MTDLLTELEALRDEWRTLGDERWATFAENADRLDSLIAAEKARGPDPLLVQARGVVESMAIQFAYDGRPGMITTGGLSALESAFGYLGWDDPHQLPDDMLCDEPGCRERSTCGFPTETGYRRTCSEHYAALDKRLGG